MAASISQAAKLRDHAKTCARIRSLTPVASTGASANNRGSLVAVKHAVDARQSRDNAPDFPDQRLILDIDMSDLMVGHGKRPRLRNVEQLATLLDADRDHSGFA